MIRGPASLVFIACLVVYHVNGRPQPQVDCVPPVYTAWSLARHGDVEVGRYDDLQYLRGSWLVQQPEGSWIACPPPGGAWSALPFVAPIAWLHPDPFRPNAMLAFGKLIAALYTAGAVALFYLICVQIVPPAAPIATLLLAFGTGMWSVASQALWAHGPATFYICVALYALLLHADAHRMAAPAIAGLAHGLATATRPSTALFAVASVVALAVGRRWHAMLAMIVGAIIPAALLLSHLTSFTGIFKPNGFPLATEFWPHPLLHGLAGLLVAPSRGLLVYSPALILVPLGLVSVLRQKGVDKPLLTRREGSPLRSVIILAWTCAAGATCVTYARWICWWGGWCYGPRFFIEAMPTFCLLFGIGYAQLTSQWAQRAAAGLVAISVLVQFIGVFGHHPDWEARHVDEERDRTLFSLHDTQIEAHARHLVGDVCRRLTGQRCD